MTPERIKHIQVEVLIRVMMGEIKSDLFPDGWALYKEEIPSPDFWFSHITGPLISGGCLRYQGVWSLTKDGEEFVKNYSAEKEQQPPESSGINEERKQT